MTELSWAEVAQAAADISWVTFVATTYPDGLPHVAVVAPGLEREGKVWFATRRDSTKHRNLVSRPGVALHWPVATGAGPGELFGRGEARVHDSVGARAKFWNRVVPYDMSGFFGSPDNPDLVFVEVSMSYVSLIGPDFTRRIWRPADD